MVAVGGTIHVDFRLVCKQSARFASSALEHTTQSGRRGELAPTPVAPAMIGRTSLPLGHVSYRLRYFVLIYGHKACRSDLNAGEAHFQTSEPLSR